MDKPSIIMDKTTDSYVGCLEGAVSKSLRLEYLVPSCICLQASHDSRQFYKRSIPALNQYINGQIEFEFEGCKPFLTNETQAVFIPPGVAYKTKNLNPGKTVRQGIAFRFSILDTLDPMYLLDVPYCLEGQGAFVGALNRDLLEVENGKEPCFLESAVFYHEIAFRLFRKIIESGRLVKDSRQIVHNNMRLHGVLSYIKKNYMTKISVKQLAKKAALSYSRFFEVFQSYTGESPNQYILNLRILKAQELLLSDLRVYEIAEQVGISDPFYFSRIFKKRVGISPEQFRLLNQ